MPPGHSITLSEGVPLSTEIWLSCQLPQLRSISSCEQSWRLAPLCRMLTSTGQGTAPCRGCSEPAVFRSPHRVSKTRSKSQRKALLPSLSYKGKRVLKGRELLATYSSWTLMDRQVYNGKRTVSISTSGVKTAQSHHQTRYQTLQFFLVQLADAVSHL